MSPVTILTVGMAGSGKTTFMQRLNSHLYSKKTPPYVINLDPAVLKLPYGCNIDIRDSIKYKKVMENYKLGPNGAIVTSLNLFSTKIDQVINIVEKKSGNYSNVIIDTPGQIECFIWSASGSIITEAFASTFPTVLAYVIDTPRNSSPTTFISNMLYACSILYKTKLPMILVFNKIDVQDAEFAKLWLKDFEAFQEALMADSQENEDGSGYMNSLVNSMSLMLEEFYSQLDVVGVSSYTGAGFDEFLEKVDNKAKEYEQDYKLERERILKDKAAKEKARKEKSLAHLMDDLGINDKKKKKSSGSQDEVDVISDVESYEEGEHDGLVLPDEEEGVEREYTFPEDRNGEIEEGSNTHDRYQEAYEQLAKEAGSKTAENIAKYINQQ